MAPFEEALAERLASGALPGGVFVAADKSGNFTFSRSAGVRSTRPENKDKPLDANTVLSIASCTKLFTAIAVMQIAERGLFSLDTDVASVLTELADVQILEGFDENDQPILEPRTKAITLRLLLSHQSGFAYDLAIPNLQKWRTSKGEVPNSGKTIRERFNYPLIFEPGATWCYGCGTDWAGKLIERVTNSTLEEYFAEKIWKPLGLTSTSFWPDKNPDLASRKADLSMFAPDGSGKAVPLQGFSISRGMDDCLGGAGLFSTATDTLALLKAVLRRDETILKADSWDQLAADQLSEGTKTVMFNLIRDDDQVYVGCGMNVPRDGPKSWSLGGLLSLKEYDGWMGKNTLLWGGFTSMQWFVDWEKGLCGFAGAQVVHFGQPGINDLLGVYLHEVYDRFAESKKGQ